ncbi:hypothetical protein MJO28_002554 [Puccinia striiformis f. sp. tritici]|uniref:RRM domain-containing protein n=3 Tax=Puccinia striiformis TaxID=27350 RepID=A0A0L0UZ96_9BASI|nr:hypothetical protein Pst134EA_005486 [Puccinia striiformis f. sp. tritici]KAI9618904.1 hypothetical protein H4Q26_012158 [Puccinia striiformis f. sp. tritici PST-130]KNE92241.1 hypothetical protein PSTG_14335 [Puccinia striiformis f. sp. tritici PST-78]POW18781.1 hypothetical protein PSHT_05388 [Puccinia striiformis]KAH9462685.1 hypothetical protein Pst134EB_006566 [Puccinia striiformis f. sp. tritici]KAH9471594.1 hypothetical protein Pst134EA_005486 [Puccinia striiformis f. sp. tritici]
MASARGRSASPKPLRTENQAPKSEPQDDAVPNGIKKAKASPRSRSASGSRRSSRGASPKIRHSDSRSMSLSRSSSENRSRSRSYSRSRSRSPRRTRARSYSGSPSRSRSRSRSGSYSSYSSRSDSRESIGRNGGGSKLVEVSKLTKNVTAEHIQEIFKVYGTIKEVDLPIVRQIGSHRGTAIVTFDTGKAAQKAVSHMDRGQLDGSLISVQIYRPPSPPRGPAAQGRGINSNRVTSGNGARYIAPRAPNAARRNASPPRRAFGGRSRSPPRRSFANSRPAAGRSNRSQSPPSYRRKRSRSRSPSRSPRRGVRRPSPQYGARSSRRNRSYSGSGSSSYTRSSRSRSRSPRK